MEKAEAIKIIKTATVYTPEEMEALETLIPELRESEDEKIRTCIGLALTDVNEQRFIDYGITLKDCLAWLEKQDHDGKKWLTLAELNRLETLRYEAGFDDGVRSEMEKQKEQKPHLELKAGKWYICHRAFCARADHLTVKEGERFQCEKDGIVKGFVIKEPEKYFKECSAPEPMEKEQKPVENPFDANETMKMKDRIDEGFTKMMMQEQKPAEWDELQSEFKNINEAFEDGKKEVVAHPERYGLCKPAEWSEEDERMLERAIHIVAEYSDIDEKESEIVQNWLNKSLRPQPSWKPSEEELVALTRVGSILRDYGHSELAKMVFIIEGKLANLAVLNKSIWKPSEEQMEALIDCVIGDEYDVHALVRLWAELKKL